MARVGYGEVKQGAFLSTWDAKNRWSGFPNPLVPFLAHAGGLGNPLHTINGARSRIAPRARSTPTFHQFMVRRGLARVRTNRDAL